MKRFATGLGQLILDLRDRIYPQGAATVITPEEKAAGKLPYDQFRVYLVAHSMGGLVCRAFLQNPAFGAAKARSLVDKVFTYATPHNGIEVGLLGNVPGWLSLYGMNTFNRDEIAKLLGLTKSPARRRQRGHRHQLRCQPRLQSRGHQPRRLQSGGRPCQHGGG